MTSGRLLRDFRNHLPRFLLGLGFLTLAGVFSAARIAILKPVFDEVLAPNTGQSAFVETYQKYMPSWAPSLQASDSIWAIPLSLMAVVFLYGVFSYGGNLAIGRVGQQMVADLRARLFGQISRQDMTFFSQFPSGTLISRVISDLERLQNASTQAFGEMLRQIIALVIFMGAAFFMEPKATLMIFVVIPVVALPLVKLTRKLRRASRGSQENTGQLTEVIRENIEGREVVRLFAQEDTEQKRFNLINTGLFRHNMRAVRVQALSGPIMELIGMAAICGFLVLGFFLLAERGWTLGAFVVYLGFLVSMYEPIKRVARLNPILQNGLVSAERAYALLDEPIRVKDPKSPQTLGEIKDKICFHNVSFSYPEGPKVLGPLQLELKRGEVVALVGESGAGKSTLLSLIPRFFDPVEGSITADGVDLKTLSLKELRGQIGLVAQHTVLFAGSVFHNISYGKPEASLADVQRAARQAYAHDFIEALESGYDTQVGEGGSSLSGGQRQRLALARAFLKNPPVLLLDEATSALDSESEHAIQEATKELFSGRAVLVIAHRLSTVRDADRILVMDQGKIIESGNHEELLHKNGAYARLHKLQFSN